MAKPHPKPQPLKTIESSKSKPKKQGLPVNILLPNMVTIAGLCAGVSAIRFAIMGNFTAAILAVLVAALCDGLDGRIARMLRGTSQFGVELDSLSDMVSFGVAPAIMLYLWTLQDLPRFGWTISLVFVACAALRLARFNTRSSGEDDPDMVDMDKRFFVGVPMPAAAFLALTPLFLSKGVDETFFTQPLVVAGFLVCISLLMVSRIPTFAFKGMHLPYIATIPLLVGVAAWASFVMSDPWVALAGLGFVYLLTLPLSVFLYWRSTKN